MVEPYAYPSLRWHRAAQRHVREAFPSLLLPDCLCAGRRLASVLGFTALKEGRSRESLAFWKPEFHLQTMSWSFAAFVAGKNCFFFY